MNNTNSNAGDNIAWVIGMVLYIVAWGLLMFIVYKFPFHNINMISSWLSEMIVLDAVIWILATVWEFFMKNY